MSFSIKSITKIKNLYILFREAYWYFLYRVIKKKNYYEYYSIRMNNLVKENSQWGLKGKEFQIQYLIKYGLKKNMLFLDYGCGAINSGRFFIDYLDKDKYVGVDVSKNVILLGEKRVDTFNLRLKNPILMHLNNMNQIRDLNKKFDIIWGQSVLTHMPPEDFDIFLKQIRSCVTSNTKILFTFGLDEYGPVQKKFKDWYYSYDNLKKLAEENNYKVKFLDDWNHPEDKFKTDKLAEFSC